MNLDIMCFCHLRWNFVYQRPQHLISRFSKTCRTFYVEEPIHSAEPDGYAIQLNKENVSIVVPHLNDHEVADKAPRQAAILNRVINDLNINNFISWYYTPMAWEFSSHLKPKMVVYDCMDELSAFKFAPPELKIYEKQLLEKADLVFTGGRSIYEAKKDQHNNIHPFPSSIDKAHFGLARHILAEPADQQHIPHPRFGFFGVIDERFDIELVRQVAEQKPDWHFVLIGPVVKIDPQTLPRYANIHYLGVKEYNELPHYLAGWDVAIMPFAINESTRYISPTKTPEYLAGGKPVIATPVRDVVEPYGNNKLVHIASDAPSFISVGELELTNQNTQAWLRKVDEFIKNDSWDNTWLQMMQMIDITLKNLQYKLSSNVHKRKPAFDFLVVGAGFAGSVIAERLASQLNKKVLVAG
ncbi:MAG: glycosyltransferase [Ferruginibacter sp.]